jgi:cobalamin-dependent methionine synthase I
MRLSILDTFSIYNDSFICPIGEMTNFMSERHSVDLRNIRKYQNCLAC